LEKKTFFKNLIKRGTYVAELSCVHQKNEIQKIQPEEGAQRRVTSPRNVLGALGCRRHLRFDAASRNQRGSVRKQRRIESAAVATSHQGAATHLKT
jgi:uncharacterized membrane protein